MGISSILSAAMLLGSTLVGGMPALERRDDLPSPDGEQVYTQNMGGLMVQSTGVNFIQARFKVPTPSPSGGSIGGGYYGRFSLTIDRPTEMTLNTPSNANVLPFGNEVAVGLEYGFESGDDGNALFYSAYFATPQVSGNLGWQTLTFSPGDDVLMRVYMPNSTAATFSVSNPNSTGGSTAENRTVILQKPISQKTASWAVIDNQLSGSPLPLFTDFVGFPIVWSNSATDESPNARSPQPGEYAEIQMVQSGKGYLVNSTYAFDKRTLTISHA